MDRPAIVAGQFYTAEPRALAAQVRAFLDQAGPANSEPTLLAMAPHAGYVYSGGVAGVALGRANLPATLLLLGPNHTGRGAALALWPDGAWRTPLGDVPVAEDLARALLLAEPRLAADYTAHVGEHSLEVMLPFLQVKNPGVRIVPVAVAEPGVETLLAVARGMAGVLAAWAEPVGIVVSSDMSHYISHQRAKERDALALERIAALDPAGLHATVRRHGISMCGVLPMTLGLAIAKELGATRAEVAAYATSGEVSGDYARVVGYAGALVWA